MKSLKNIAALFGFASFCFSPFLIFKAREIVAAPIVAQEARELSVEVSTDGRVEWRKVAANDVIHVVVDGGRLVKVDSMANGPQ